MNLYNNRSILFHSEPIGQNSFNGNTCKLISFNTPLII